MNTMDLTQRGVLQTTNLLAAGTMSLGEAALAGLAESPFSIQSTQVDRITLRGCVTAIGGVVPFTSSRRRRIASCKTSSLRPRGISLPPSK